MPAIKLFEKKSLFLISLVALFVVAFALPVFFAYRMARVIYHYDTADDETSKETIFPEAVSIGATNSFLAIKSSPSIEPVEGQDFLLTVWFKFRKLPAPGETMQLLSKYDAESSSRRGYALAIERDSKGIIYPEIYWRDETNNGTWFKFQEIALQQKVWTLFAVSFRSGKYLGLHTAFLPEAGNGQLKMSGGYQLDNKVLPKSDSDLLIGAFNLGKFRGQIGPIAIFTREKLTNNLDQTLQQILEDPINVPSVFTNDQVKLLVVDGKSDSGSANNKVEFIKPKRAEKE